MNTPLSYVFNPEALASAVSTYIQLIHLRCVSSIPYTVALLEVVLHTAAMRVLQLEMFQK